jgi:hypothetical protein
MPRRGSVRRTVTIARPAAEVWAVVGDPARLAEWFPGVEAVTVQQGSRFVQTAAGLGLREEIVTFDPLAHRLQVRLHGPRIVEHLSTLDVVALGPSRCLVLYGADAEPAAMALLVAGAAGAGLQRLAARLETRGERTGGC